MKVETVKCDECGIQKQEANHWFKAIDWEAGHFEIVRAEAASDAFLDYKTRTNDFLDLCSEQCATKAMSKAIGARK